MILFLLFLTVCFNLIVAKQKSHVFNSKDATLFNQFDHRGGSNLTMGRNQTYDYVPSIIWDESLELYRMWWCGGSGGNPSANFTGGDHVLYAESSSLDGPWHSHDKPNKAYSYDVHLYPSNVSNTFDFTHACDPNVISVNGTYYLYYGGGNEQLNPSTTRIGLAVSNNNGYPPWTRYYANNNINNNINNGNNIDNNGENQLRALINPTWGVNGKGDGVNVPNYGCGQPSVFYYNSWYYMVFTDLSGLGAMNENVVYVIRSNNPYFQSDTDVFTHSTYTKDLQTELKLQELSSNGWFDIMNINGNLSSSDNSLHNHSEYYFTGGASTDWVFVPIGNENGKNYVMFGVDGPFSNATELQWWDIDYLNGTTINHKPIGINYVGGIWTEGPGIVHIPNGTAVIKKDATDSTNSTNSTTLVYADVFRSVSDGSSTTPWSWWLSHDGVTIQIN